MKQIANHSKEMHELMEFFDKIKIVSGRYDKEHRDMWSSGAWYQDGVVNQAFKIFLAGANYGIRDCY